MDSSTEKQKLRKGQKNVRNVLQLNHFDWGYSARYNYFSEWICAR